MNYETAVGELQDGSGQLAVVSVEMSLGYWHLACPLERFTASCVNYEPTANRCL